MNFAAVTLFHLFFQIEQQAVSLLPNVFFLSKNEMSGWLSSLAFINIFSDLALYFDRHIFTRKIQNIPLLHTPQKGTEDTERKKIVVDIYLIQNEQVYST